MKGWAVLAALTSILALVSAQLSVINNGDFEEPDEAQGDSNWQCSRCHGTIISSGAFSGNYSYVVTNRTKRWGGPYQYTTSVELNKRYFVSGWLKLLNVDPDNTPVTFRILATHTLLKDDGTTTREGQPLVLLDDITVEDGWVNLNAEVFLTEFDLPLQGISLATDVRSNTGFYNDFVIDKFEMYEMQNDPNWKESAAAEKEIHRKSSLSVTLRPGRQVQEHVNSRVSIRQISGQFGVGSSVDGFLLKNNEKYKTTFLNNFEWAELESDMSWRKTEYSKNVLTWEDADDGMSVLEANNKIIRGGSIHEANSVNSPDFIMGTTNPDDIYRFSMKRVDDVVGRYRYRCEHWDVSNEMLGGSDHLSSVYGSDFINNQLFRRARDVDYAAKLFINENSLLASYENIQKVITKVAELRRLGVEVDGIGAQAMFADEYPDGQLIRARLNRLAAAGLPIWISRYSYSDANITRRAQAFQDFMLAVSSHPQVEGVMLKDFWDGHSSAEDASFFDGADFTPNAAGESLQQMIGEMTGNDELISTFDMSATDDNRVIILPAIHLYHGEYEIRVEKANGQVVRQQLVSILKHKGDESLTLWL